MSRRRLLVVVVAAGALDLAAADVARRAPAFAIAGGSLVSLGIGVAAGWVLLAAGFVARQPPLSAAGVAWPVAWLGTPGAHGPLEFTLGLVCAGAVPALVGHAVLQSSGARRALVMALYGSLIGALGVLPLLSYAPCPGCPGNLLAIADAPGAQAGFTRAGIVASIVALAATVVFAVAWLMRISAAGRSRTGPLVIASCVYLVLAAAVLGHGLGRGYLSNDRTDQALWIAEVVAVFGVGAGAAWLQYAARRRRAQLARVVVELAETQRPGGLRVALATLLQDPQLEILYRHGGGWMDPAGTDRTPPPGRAATLLMSDQEPVALLSHRPGVLDDARLVRDIEQSLRLGLDHERLRLELSRRLAQVRRSRAEVAEVAEAERRRLERDLHDGTQQRLVAVAFALGIAHTHASAADADRLERARRAVQAALAELREVAHGLYPVALAEAGLPAAIESLGDRRPGLRVGAIPAGRLAPPTEEAAYLAIASLADHWTPASVELSATREQGRLVIEAGGPAGEPPDLMAIEDRIVALGGSISMHPESGRVTMELPCA